MTVSIVAPMYNEEDNLQSTLSKLKTEFQNNEINDYEIIFVNDGSTDNTLLKAKELEKNESQLKVIGYDINQGRGKALRTGFDFANGDIICSIDFDLSYDASHVTRMIKEFEKNPIIDLVLVSAYMPGGKTIGVSPFRLLISKLGNYIYRYAFSPKIYTSTCVVRAYKKEVIKSLWLDSDDKEIHLEIISKALANNYKHKEIPGTLTKRKVGKSKFKFRSTSVKHLIFLVQERPIILFGFFGFILLVLSIFSTSFLIYGKFFNSDFFSSAIGRIFSPNLVLILFLGGINMLGLGFIGIQNNLLKKELFKIQKTIKKK
tara:strand:+ start:15665 stop:16615 length:951 start_codon:yes stop_codon:yes gene_type:complete